MKKANQEESEDSESLTPPITKGKQVTGEARVPSSKLRRYKTSFYYRYIPGVSTPIEPVRGPFKAFYYYDHYLLFIQDDLKTVEEVPTSGVRIDDLTISRIIQKFKTCELHRNWPADLDQRGMIRATRMPLGNAAKIWVNAGEADVNGNHLVIGEEGYYYKWWRGLHCLMGKEGMDAGLYRIRPSHEKFLVDGFTWKKEFKAVIQEAEGGDE